MGYAYPTFGTQEWWDRHVEFGDCWIANGATTNGYAKVWTDGRRKKAHRAVWELLVGPIPEGMTIDHLCRVRRCVNPDHLRVVTMGENCKSSPAYWASQYRKKQGPYCKRGHERTLENTYVRPSGATECRVCHREAVLRDYYRDKEAACV